MPSKYKLKQPKPQTKQDAELPYKRHWVPPPPKGLCDYCGRVKCYTELAGQHKCSCGGTYRKV